MGLPPVGDFSKYKIQDTVNLYNIFTYIFALALSKKLAEAMKPTR